MDKAPRSCLKAIKNLIRGLKLYSLSRAPFVRHGDVPLLTPGCAHLDFNRSRMSKKLVVRVYIVRHGETQENRDGIIQGQRDTSLNANGEEQAWMVGEALKDAKIGVAFSSDLSRAVKVRRSNQTRDIGTIPSVGFG